MQQCVCQMTFRNVYEFKKLLAKSGVVWSRTLLILLSMNGETVSIPVFAQCTRIWSNFIVGSQPKCQKVNKICSCALFRFSTNTALGKKAIFHWFWFQTDRLQVRWEFNCKLSQEYLYQNLLKSDNPALSYNRKCLGCFLRHCLLAL